MRRFERFGPAGDPLEAALGAPAPDARGGRELDSGAGEQVAVWAGLTGPAVTAANEFGIWLSDPTTGALALRVRAGDPAPELPGLTLRGVSSPILNDPGDLVFRATLEGPGATLDTDEAIFVIESGGVARKVLRESDLVSFGPGDLRPLAGFSMLEGTLSDVPGVGQLSDSGYLAFAAHAPDGTNAGFLWSRSLRVSRCPAPANRSGTGRAFARCDGPGS